MSPGTEYERERSILHVEGRDEEIDLRHYTGSAWINQNGWCVYWCNHAYRAKHAATVIRQALRDPRNDPASMMRVTHNLTELRTVLSRAETGIRSISSSEAGWGRQVDDLRAVVSILDKYRRTRV